MPLPQPRPSLVTGNRDTFRPVTKITIIGWREYIEFPELAVPRVKAKIDTGARSSALHAFDIRRQKRDGQEWVRFAVHPVQRDDDLVIECEAPLHDERMVRSSTGHEQLRPVIRPLIRLGGRRFRIDLTLASRDMMGFRMLLGREAVRRRFLVDAGHSFLLSDEDAT